MSSNSWTPILPWVLEVLRYCLIDKWAFLWTVLEIGFRRTKHSKRQKQGTVRTSEQKKISAYLFHDLLSFSRLGEIYRLWNGANVFTVQTNKGEPGSLICSRDNSFRDLFILSIEIVEERRTNREGVSCPCARIFPGISQQTSMFGEVKCMT